VRHVSTKLLLVGLAALAGPAGAGERTLPLVTREQKVYLPRPESIAEHRAPAWYEDAKFGIFVHWGLYSVPAWAPPSGTHADMGPREWVWNKAYAEWYMNSMHLQGSPTWKHHVATWGEGFDYYDFAGPWNEALRRWDPEAMAALLAEAGARYVVLTAKHHDGYTLWPSRVANPNLPDGVPPPARDVVGELSRAARARALRMGLYYSGGLDWTFYRTPIADETYMRETVPQGLDYAAYADAHLRELVYRYRPSVLWNDISYPKQGSLLEILANYYNLVPEGVVNDRWGQAGVGDFATAEYERARALRGEKWEACRGMGFSFGYNQAEDESHTLSVDAIVDLLADLTSKNANLLLNVGPMADGTIPPLQAERLRGVGRWLRASGEAIYGTRPWTRAEGTTAEGGAVRFTRKGGTLYAILLERPPGASVTIRDLRLAAGSRVELVGLDAPLRWEARGADVLVRLPATMPGEHAFALRIRPLP